MLSEFQREKLTYFFNLLDLSRNGSLQLEDFSEIAERVREQLGYDYSGDEYRFIVNKAVHFFHQLLRDIPKPEKQGIDLEQWLEFFDKRIVNGNDRDFQEEYLENVIGFLFDLFDENHDGYISVEEYADLFLMYGIDIKYSAKSFINLDLNRDDRLSKNEILHAVEVFFTSDDPSEKGNWVFGKWK